MKKLIIHPEIVLEAVGFSLCPEYQELGKKTAKVLSACSDAGSIVTVNQENVAFVEQEGASVLIIEESVDINEANLARFIRRGEEVAVLGAFDEACCGLAEEIVRNQGGTLIEIEDSQFPLAAATVLANFCQNRPI